MTQETSRPENIDQWKLENDKVEIDEEITAKASKETILKHIRKNIELSDGLHTPRSMRLKGGDFKAKVDPRDEGAYYPDSPHPIWRDPEGFIEGMGHEEDHDLQRPFPSRHDHLMEARRQAENDQIEVEEGTEEFNELVDEWYEEDIEMWNSQAKQLLKDEIIVSDGENTILVHLEYE